MKRILAVLVFISIAGASYASNIFFPEFDLFTTFSSGVSNLLDMTTSYRIDMVVDTGIKYGVQIGLGLKAYNIQSLRSNFVELDSIRLDTEPFNLFHLGMFTGKNTTLGLSDYGYSGFQFHRRPYLEYIGYKDIYGNGLEIYRSFWQNMLTPHILVYSAPALNGGAQNVLTFDTLLKFETEKIDIEGYFGVGIDPNRTGENTLKHFGLTLQSKFNKVDFMISLYSPDTAFSETVVPDDFYLNVSEHLLSGIFEQTLTLFSRPRYYNFTYDNMTNDIDFYLALGLRFENVAVGAENSIEYSENYDLFDQAGVYTYFLLNNLKYKVSVYYNIPFVTPAVKGTPYTTQWGVDLHITGTM